MLQCTFAVFAAEYCWNLCLQHSLSLCLCSCFSSSGCRFQSRRRRGIRRRSPPPPGPSAVHKAEKDCGRIPFERHSVVCVMSVQLPVFPARSPLPYTGCSFSPADCPPSAGPPGLWPLLGHHHASEPARLLTRQHWQEEEIKERRRISHLRCAFTLNCYAQMAPSFPKNCTMKILRILFQHTPNHQSSNASNKHGTNNT